jgi:WD40 repeat protein
MRDQSKSIPVEERFAADLKNGCDILVAYEKVQHQSKETIQSSIKDIIRNYTLEQLVGEINFINYLDCPDVQKVCFDELKIRYRGDMQAVISNEKLDADLRQLFIAQPAVDCLTGLIQRQNAKDTKRVLVTAPDLDYAVNSVAFNSDGTKIILGEYGGFEIVDTLTGIRLVRVPRAGVAQAVFSPDDTKIVAGGESNSNLTVWDAITGAMIHDLVGHRDIVWAVAFSPDGTKIVSGSRGRQDNLKVWDAVTGNLLFDLVGHRNDVKSVAFSHDGTKIVSGGKDGNLIIWDALVGNLIEEFDLRWLVSSVVFSPDNSKILYVCGGEIVLLDIDKKNHTALWTEGDPRIARFNVDGSKIVVAGERNINVLTIDNNYKVTHQIYLRTGSEELWHSLNSVVISSNSRTIVSGYGSHYYYPCPALIENTLWTDEDDTITNRIKNGTFAETKLILKLCSELKKQGSVKELPSGSADAETFQRFSKKMQEKLTNIFWPPKQKGWFSGWW